MVKSIGQNILRFDFNLFVLVSSRREGAFLKQFYKGLSHLGNGHLYALIALRELLAGGGAGKLFFFSALLAFGLELPVYLLVKNSVKRLRPSTRHPELKFLIVPPDQYSFPSGHTAAAFLMAQLLGYQLPFLVLPLYILAGLIGYSRIYLRVHYPLDVFFGAVLGFVSANFALKLLF
ncbi:undecaprenyl pyrophosphate phosphatase [bacterium BMS3Abin05]|nr:undecaprenyl pyrophosphate phosphatase [bacterium BMS3Abin05]GBE27598.1 undecaprenyl pyrophosphate phosphatase [bacterium BMS3Bbin03]HDK35919.1 phosphatase PAP2 family protein [Bacteroidota bacterium]